MSWAEPVSWWKYTNSIFKTRHFYTPRWSCISDNETLQAATLFQLSVCVDLSTYVSYLFVCLCVFTLHSCLRSPQDQNNSWESHFCHSSIPLVCCRSALSLTCCPITHMHTHTHSQPIRGQKRVTFAYLVSRVTRKKLSSGASIQLGRLLRIITPPRVFPLLLLRPLCCRKTFTYHFIQMSGCSCTGLVQNKGIRHLPGGVHLLFLGSLWKQGKDAQHAWGNLSLVNIIDEFISFPSYKWCNKNDCVSISVIIVKLPIKNKVSDWSWIIQIIQMTPICWFVFIRISCHSLQRASLDKKWQKRLSTPGVFPLIGFYQAKRTTRTLDINTVWSPRFIHIRGNSVKSKTGCIFQFFFGGVQVIQVITFCFWARWS